MLKGTLKAQKKKILSTKSLRLTRKLICAPRANSNNLVSSKMKSSQKKAFSATFEVDFKINNNINLNELTKRKDVTKMFVFDFLTTKLFPFESYLFRCKEFNFYAWSANFFSKIICAWGANFLCSNFFYFELSAWSFVAFDDYPLRDKLDLFLLEVSNMNLTAQIFWASSTNLFRSCIQNFALKIIFVWASSVNTFLLNLRVKRRSPLRK